MKLEVTKPFKPHYLKRGQIVIVGLVFLVVILILVGSLFSRTSGFIHFGGNTVREEQAIELTDAGINEAIFQLNKTAGSYTGETNTSIGTTGAFTVTVSDENPPNPQLKSIVSTGCVPNCTNPAFKNTVKVDTKIDSTSVSFKYAIQTGGGGVNLQNAASITGTVYSNGSITGSGTSSISGDAYATGTISSPAPTVSGTKHPGASQAPLPAFDYNYWKTLANGGNDPATCPAGSCTTCSPTCTISTSSNIGPQKYFGNLTISNNAQVIMKGPIYVTGDFSMSQGGTSLKLDDSFGSNNSVLITDGVVTLTQGGTFQTTNATPPGYITLVSTSSNSQAIQISQSGTTAIFNAINGGAYLSQSAHVAALVSASLTMINNSVLQYDTGLAGAQFSTCSTCPGASWVIKKGTYIFTKNP